MVLPNYKEEQTRKVVVRNEDWIYNFVTEGDDERNRNISREDALGRIGTGELWVNQKTETLIGTRGMMDIDEYVQLWGGLGSRTTWLD